MTGIMPVVQHDVAVGACSDLLRPLIEDASADPLTAEIQALVSGNPELAGAVTWFADGGKLDAMEALAVAALVCKALRAQVEVDALEGLRRTA
jgi:hypothetical protein